MSDIARWSWNIVSISDANGAYVSVDDHLADKQAAIQAALGEAANIAYEVKAYARRGDGQETADLIGRRILALMGETP
jgi:hypothetical protein